MSRPKKSDNYTQGCKCDHCGKSLHAKFIWWWEEHLGCSQDCVRKEYFKARPELKNDKADTDKKIDPVPPSTPTQPQVA